MTIKNIKRYLSLTNVLMIICVILFVSLVGVMLKLYNRGSDVPLSALKSLNEPVRNWKDDLGRTHAEKPAVDLDKETAQVVLKSLYDSVCTALSIKSNQVEDLRAIGSTTSDIILPAATQLTGADSGCHISYSDKWFSLGGRVCSAHDSLRYTYVDSFHIARYWQRDRFLGIGIGKKHSYMDAYSLNKKTIVKGLTGVDITDQSYERASLSGYGGYRSMPILQSFSAGVELEISLTRHMSVELNGEYYLHNGQFRPAVYGKAKFSLIKF